MSSLCGPDFYANKKFTIRGRVKNEDQITYNSLNERDKCLISILRGTTTFNSLSLLLKDAVSSGLRYTDKPNVIEIEYDLLASTYHVLIQFIHEDTGKSSDYYKLKRLITVTKVVNNNYHIEQMEILHGKIDFGCEAIVWYINDICIHKIETTYGRDGKPISKKDLGLVDII